MPTTRKASSGRRWPHVRTWGRHDVKGMGCAPPWPRPPPAPRADSGQPRAMGVQVRPGRRLDRRLAHPDARRGQAEIRPSEERRPDREKPASVVRSSGAAVTGVLIIEIERYLPPVHVDRGQHTGLHASRLPSVPESERESLYNLGSWSRRLPITPNTDGIARRGQAIRARCRRHCEST